MKENKKKIAVIGAGHWGENLIRVFFQLGVLDTICDTDQEKLILLKNNYPGLRTTTSYGSVLNDPSIAAVVVSTPAETHYALAKEALLSGKDVFVEKPLALQVFQGAELIDLANSRKRILMVGHLLEFHPAIRKLKELVQKGDLGKIQYIYSNRLNLGKFRREENILWSFAPHDISVILLLLDEMPESALSSGGNYLNKKIADTTLSVLNFSSGVKAHIFVSWLHPYKEQKLIVVGDKKMAVFDDVAGKDKLVVYNHKINWINQLPVSKKESARRVAVNSEEPLVIECKHFYDCIHTRTKPKTDGQNALRVLKVLQACQKSLEQHASLVNLNTIQWNPQYINHPSSEIEEGSIIGENTTIWHYSHVMKGAIIGKNCKIGQNVFIGSKAVIGNNVKIQNNVSIYDRVLLEDDVFCGPSVVFTNVINPRSGISRKNEYKETLIKKGATLGANSTIICGNNIGEYALIGAGAVVTRNIPAYGLVYGNPARLKGWMCQCGEKLDVKKSAAVCIACGKKYSVNEKKVTIRN